MVMRMVRRCHYHAVASDLAWGKLVPNGRVVRILSSFVMMGPEMASHAVVVVYPSFLSLFALRLGLWPWRWNLVLLSCLFRWKVNLWPFCSLQWV